MIHLDINANGHKWEKQNLVTVLNGRKHYDIMKCAKCGIFGKTTSLTTIKVKSTYSKEKIFNCDGRSDVPKRIKIKYCQACGPQFKNLLPDSEHDVVTPPAGYKNDHTGVWVMGIGEPVKVLSNEYVSLG